MASRQWRSSLQWNRVDTPPDRTWLCPPCSHVEASTLRQMPFGSHTKTRYRCYSLTKSVDFTRLTAWPYVGRDGLLFWTKLAVTQNYTYPEQTPFCAAATTAPRAT